MIAGLPGCGLSAMYYLVLAVAAVSARAWHRLRQSVYPRLDHLAAASVPARSDD